MLFKKVVYVTQFVSDQDKALDFYARLLDFGGYTAIGLPPVVIVGGSGVVAFVIWQGSYLRRPLDPYIFSYGFRDHGDRILTERDTFGVPVGDLTTRPFRPGVTSATGLRSCLQRT